MGLKAAIIKHQRRLGECRLCENMIPPVIIGNPVPSPVLLIGQAPGVHEGEVGRPFGWTAGKTLFKWFANIGMDETAFRERVYMSAVCRCFPGKQPKGGDRVPSADEIARCSRWINAEIGLLQPELIIPVGKLAITRYLPVKKLVDAVGQRFELKVEGCPTVMIPLPHPSGASTWHRMTPGKQLLDEALRLIEAEPVWQRLRAR